MRNIGKQQILWPDRIKQRLRRVFTENPLFVILQCNTIVRSDRWFSQNTILLQISRN